MRELAYEMREDIQLIYKQTTPKGAPLDLEKLDELVKGSVDIHMHPAPDAYAARPFDDIQLAIQACEMGMGAVVYKCHSFPTARSAIIAQRIVDEWTKGDGKERTRVIGGAVLNYSIGALNPQAVESVAGLGGRFIWTPSLDSSHHRKISGLTGGIEVIDSNDKVTSEFAEILRLIAKHDLVLSITHHSTKERFIMIDAAVELGVKRIEVCHVTAPVTKTSIEQMEYMAKKGAYLGLYCVNFAPPLFDIDEAIEAIRNIGSDHFVLGSDLGNWRLPPPAINYRIFLGLLLENGIAEPDIEKMAKLNPKKLIF